MEIWPTANYEHLYPVEIEIAAGMFADLESLMCDQFDHLRMICHVFWAPPPRSETRQATRSWQGMRQSGLGCIILLFFFVVTIGLAKLRLAA